MSENKEAIVNDTDDSLDTLLENMRMNETEDLDALIEKRVNRRIRHIVVRVLALILIPLILARMVLSPFLNAVNVNPYQMNREFVNVKEDSIIMESTLYRTLDAWIETQFPYSELDWVSVQRLGYGNYEINAHVIDLKQPVSLGDSANVRFTMKTGTLLLDQNISNINKFRDDFTADENEKGIEEKTEEISAFPDSSWIYAAVSLTEPLEISTILEIENDDFSIDWAQVYTEDSEASFGINLNHVLLNDPEGIRTELSPAELKQLFLTRLDLIRPENSIFTKEFGIANAISSPYVIYRPQACSDLITEFTETLENTEGFTAKNYYVSATKQALLNFMETMKPDSIKIIDARLFKG